jgi:hypothetical protein
MTAIANHESTIHYSGGTKRNVYRVLESGLVQTGTQTWRDGQWVHDLRKTWEDAAARWVVDSPAVEDWQDWGKADVVKASRSPNGIDEHKWFCRLPADVRQAVREHYGLVQQAAHPCAGRKDGCPRTVAVAGTYCDRCQHDEH